MVKRLHRLLGLTLHLSATCALAQVSAIGPSRLNADEATWIAFPGGVYRADLAGSEKTTGLYAYRVKFPAGFKRQPHFHPDDKIVTVLSGTVYVGYGEQFDESGMKALSVGAIWTEPMKQPHYVWAKDGEVVIQVVGFGPTGDTFVQRKP